MKKKFSLWLNIVTICLCVCAIAIGVYAASQATLTISGQIGFTAHEVDMNVTAYMYGHATSEDGDPILEKDKVSLIGTNAESDADDYRALEEKDTIKFTQDNSAIYFSDMTSTDANGKPEDIKVVVTLTAADTLKFDVLVSASGTSVDTNIQITTEITNTVVKYQGEAAEKTTTITFTLSVKPNAQSGVYEEVANTNNVTLNIQLDKLSAKENVIVHTFENPTSGTCQEKFPYYIEFGEVGETSLKWLVIGVDSGNDTMAALTDADKSILASGYMLKNKNYYLLSENVLYTESTTNYDLSFQNQYTQYTATSYLNAYEKNANDYATSNVRAYLNGATVQRETNSQPPYREPSGTEVNFSTYEFTDDEIKMIQPREVSSLMNGLSVTSGTISTAAPTGDKPDSVTDSIHNALTKTADNFWLLSIEEVQTVFGVSPGVGASSLRATVQGTATGGTWWFRSPIASSGYTVWGVSNVGREYSYDANLVGGVRPAFKI